MCILCSVLTTVFNFTTLWLYIIPNCTRLLFIARKVSISTCLGERFPAAEKIRSDGVEVAGMHRKYLASFDSVGKRPSFSLHHLRGSSLLESVASPKYSRTSLITTWIFRFTETVCVRRKEGFQSTLSTWTIGPLQWHGGKAESLNLPSSFRKWQDTPR